MIIVTIKMLCWCIGLIAKLFNWELFISKYLDIYTKYELKKERKKERKKEDK